MMNSFQSDILKVALLTISPHNRAILEFFFAGAGKHLFRMTSIQDADALILDYDHAGAKDEWERVKQQYNKPFIVLSVRELSLENTIWVSKPLTSKALTQAAQQTSHFVPRQINFKQSMPAQLVSQPTTSRMDSDNKTVSAPPNVRTQTPPPSAQLFVVPARPVNPVPPAPVIKLASIPSIVAAPNIPAAPAIKSRPDLVAPTPKALVTEDKGAVDQVRRSVLTPSQQQKRYELLCGTRADATIAMAQQSGLYFVAENHLLKYLIDALRLARETGQTVQLKFNAQHYLLLMPKTHYSFCTLGLYSEQFVDFCYSSISPVQVQIHIPNQAELTFFDKQVADNPNYIYDLEAFIWSASLLTAQGRLSENVAPEQPYRLKHWPNLTRLEQIPHIMRIAAVWSQQPGTVFELAERLAIPQRYVFAFHSAANSLGLFELMPQKSVRTSTSTPSNNAPKKNRGLFSRLLKRLLGGGSD